METLVTYKYYDGKGRRLAIFGELTPRNELQITVIPCSRKDQFSKETAKFLFETSKKSDEVFCERHIIPIIEGAKAGFNLFCKQMFYKPTLNQYWENKWVIEGDKTRVVRVEKGIRKLSMFI